MFQIFVTGERNALVKIGHNLLNTMIPRFNGEKNMHIFFIAIELLSPDAREIHQSGSRKPNLKPF